MNFAFPNAWLLVFAKAPVPGRVKTRLAGSLGARGAAELYKKLLRRSLAEAHSARLCPVEGIAWSTPTVLAASRRRLKRDGSDWAELPLGGDVDTLAELRRWRRLQAEPLATSASPKYSAV